MNQRSAQMKKQMFNQLAKQQAAAAAAAKQHEEAAAAAKQQQEQAAKQEAEKKEEIKRMRNKLAQDERLQMEYNLMKHRLQNRQK